MEEGAEDLLITEDLLPVVASWRFLLIADEILPSWMMCVVDERQV